MSINETRNGLTLIFFLLTCWTGASAQTTSFTYQGKLTDNGTAADGTYQMQFALFATASGGTPIGNETLTNNSVSVNNGIFTVELNFTDPAALDGSTRWLEIAVKKPADPTFITLTTRQKLTSAPYAIKSLNAANSTQLGGVAANQYVQTSDTRLSDDRNPLPNSTNYIQNTTLQQPANFNVSGNGTAAGTLSATVVNGNTQFNIAGARAFILYDPTGIGATDSFAGSLAGAQNVSGRFNSFFGCGAGQSNTGGTGNSYFGCGAGGNNTNGGENTFVGRSAGFGYFGGSRNSFFGSFAGNGLGATANDVSLFGYHAGNANTASGNTFVGSFAGDMNSSGDENTFIGFETGKVNTTTFKNTFVGYRAGAANTAINNTFLGAEAGQANMNGSANTFVGTLAGQANTSGAGNVFLGYLAGLGNSPGQGNVSGASNTLIGVNTNVGASNLSNATAIGAEAYVTQNNSLVLGGISGVNNGTDVRVGIGTTAPAFKLHIIDASTSGLRVQTNGSGGTVASFGGNGAFQVDAPGVAGGRLTITQNGLVGIGTNDPQTYLDVNGLIKTNIGVGGTTALCQDAIGIIAQCASSMRYKRNVTDFRFGLGLIRRLRPVTFNWKANNQEDMGLVAEDVAKLEPLLVTHNDKGEIEGVKYDRVAVVLVNAIKEQQAQIESEQKMIQSQQKLITNQQRQINSLKKQFAQIPRPKPVSN